MINYIGAAVVLLALMVVLVAMVTNSANLFEWT